MTKKLDELFAQLDLGGATLEHVGVKGMKWGVRKSDDGGSSRSSSRKSSSLHDKTVVSTGRKFIKRALGDKTYWKRTALIYGIGLPTTIAAATLAPGLLPASVIASSGGTYTSSIVIASTGMRAIRIANLANYVNYWRRSSPKNNIKHAENDDKTIQDVFDELSELQQNAIAVLVVSHINKVDVSGDDELLQAWSSMTDDQRRVGNYIISIASQTEEDALEQTSMSFDEFLAHYGIKGMKWGIRKDRDYSNTVPGNIQLRRKMSSLKPGETVLVEKHAAGVRVSKATAENVAAAKNVSTEPKSGLGTRTLMKDIKKLEPGQSIVVSGTNQKSARTGESVDAIRAHETLGKIRAAKSVAAASDADLNHLVNRLNLEKRFDEVNPSGLTRLDKNTKKALGYGQTVNSAIKFVNSPAGNLLTRQLGLSKSAGKHAKPLGDVLKATGSKKKKNK